MTELIFIALLTVMTLGTENPEKDYVEGTMWFSVVDSDTQIPVKNGKMDVFDSKGELLKSIKTGQSIVDGQEWENQPSNSNTNFYWYFSYRKDKQSGSWNWKQRESEKKLFLRADSYKISLPNCEESIGKFELEKYYHPKKWISVHGDRGGFTSYRTSNAIKVKCKGSKP